MELSRGYSRITFIAILFTVVAIVGGIWITRINDNVAIAASQYSPTLTSPASGAVQRGNPAQTWTVPDASKVAYFIYESYYDNALSNHIFTTNVYGNSRAVTGNQTISIWWRVIAVHKDGSKHTSEPSSLIVDNTKPVITDSTATQHPSTTTATIAGSVTEPNLESVSLKLDGTDVDSSAVTLTGNDFTAELQNLTIGNHTVEITATDKAGNKSAVRTHAFTVTDTIAPVITITSPTTFVEDEDVVITGTATDNHSEVSEVSIHVNGAEKGTATVTNGKFSHSLGQLAPGTYEITVKGTDAAGNEATSDPVTLTITAKPVVTPPIVVNPETPDPTPAEPTPSPQSQPAPTRTTYLQPAANTAQTTTDTPDDEEATVEVDALALNNSLSARAQDIRGTTDSKNLTPGLLGFAWYYWVIAALTVTVITLWGLLVGRRRKEEEQ